GPIDGAAADARTAGAFRLDGAADPPLHVDPTSPDRGTGAVADYLAARMGVDPARLHVDPIGGGATGALLFKVKLGDADVGVFKLFPDADDALIEMQILDLLDNAGLDRFHAVGNRTDQPVPVDGGGSGMLMDAAQGGSVASRIQHLSSDPVVREPQLRELERNMQQVAEAMAELHTASGGGQQMDPAARASDAGYVRGKLTNPDTQGRLGPDADDIVAAFDAQVVQFMADPVPRGAYHGDANAGNFMIDGDGVDVSDVGTMQWSLDRTVPGLVGNRTGIADVARFRESLETLAPGALHPDELAHLRATFDDAYAAATGVDPGHIRAARRIYAVEAPLAVLRYNTARDPAIDRRVVANIKAILGLS
ncbi:MAG TPA: phosphotransferase, partial [Kofleriaceae bacterium]